MTNGEQTFFTFCFIIIVVVFICLISKILSSSGIKKDKTVAEDKTSRRRVKDVKAGEIIYIEWHKIVGRIGQLKCINNDPETEKILLEVEWKTKDADGNNIERVIFRYDSFELQNFHLLNKVQNKNAATETDFDISALQKQMNEAIEKEEYEKADELQKKIDNILKKPK